MNNQAAQTMPELPKSDHWGFEEQSWLYTDNQVHQYARDYAAALSQTAGVPEVTGESGARIEILRRICSRGRNYFFDKKDSAGIDLFEHMDTELGWLASSLAAAPAASGWEGAKMKRSDCDDPTCGCKDPAFTEPMEALRFLSGRFKCAGVSHAVAQSYARDIDAILKTEPPSGASVSERAREILAQTYEASAQPTQARLTREDSMTMIYFNTALRAIERALSSPRQEGECVGEVVAEGYAPHECVSFYAGVKQLPIGTKLYTHPSTATEPMVCPSCFWVNPKQGDEALTQQRGVGGV